MNMYQELDRVTAPEPVAGQVRVLSPAEIAELVERGEVTPVERIPTFRVMAKVSYSWER